MLGSQVHPLTQTLFLNYDAVFQEDNTHIHSAGTVQSWFEKYECELQHFHWSAQSPSLNIHEPLWSVLETRVRNRFPPATSGLCSIGVKTTAYSGNEKHLQTHSRMFCHVCNPTSAANKERTLLLDVTN
jgi:hypothetical protein